MHFIFTILLIFSFQCSAAASEEGKRPVKRTVKTNPDACTEKEEEKYKTPPFDVAELWSDLGYYKSMGHSVEDIEDAMDVKDYHTALWLLKALAQFVQDCNEEEGEFPYGVDLDAEEYDDA